MNRIDRLTKSMNDAKKDYHAHKANLDFANTMIDDLPKLFKLLDVTGRDKQAVVRRATNALAKLDRSMRESKFMYSEYTNDLRAAKEPTPVV